MLGVGVALVHLPVQLLELPDSVRGEFEPGDERLQIELLRHFWVRRKLQVDDTTLEKQINVSQNLPRRSDAAPEIARGRRDSWLRGDGCLLCLLLVDQRREEREEDESGDAFRAVRCFRQSGLNRNSKMIIIPFTQIYSS